MKKFFSLLAAALLFLPTSALAAEFKTGAAVSIPSTMTVNDNLYGAGQTITIDGQVNGDVSVAGANVSVSGKPTGDVNAAGGTVRITGTTGGDVRVAGGNVTIESQAAGDTIGFGGSLLYTQSASTSKTLVLAGGQVIVAGAAGDGARLYGDTVTLSGRIIGNVEVNAQKLVVEDSAVIAGSLNYKSPVQAQISNQARISGETNFIQIAQRTPQSKTFSAVAAGWLVGLLMSLVLSLVLYFVFPIHVVESTSYAFTHFGKELLRGFVLLITVPIAALIVMVTVIGIPLSIIALLLYVIFLLLASAVANILIGALTVKFIKRAPVYSVTWVVILVGVVIRQLISLIPIVGWLFNFVFFLVALGTLSLLFYRSTLKTKIVR